MAKNQTSSSAERPTHPLFDEIRALPAATGGLFAYSVKIVCGQQTRADCCCVAGTRPGVYATEVNIQNLNLVPAPVVKFVQPLINSGAVVGREPNVVDPTTLGRRSIDRVILPPLGATMDDCCRITELLLGASPSGDGALTIAILTIVSQFELSVSAVYTANPLTGDGISIDVEYVASQRLGVSRQ